jgi:hypothetical protein
MAVATAVVMTAVALEGAMVAEVLQEEREASMAAALAPLQEAKGVDMATEGEKVEAESTATSAPALVRLGPYPVPRKA